MSNKKLMPEILPPKVPGYIVTFSDMVTLLLTFFVMLLTLANDQDPELFNKGRDSFIKSIKYVGLGMFFGRQDMPEFDSVKTRHSIEDGDEQAATRRTIDAEREKIRRILDQIGQFGTVMFTSLGLRLNLTPWPSGILRNTATPGVKSEASRTLKSTFSGWQRTN